MELSKLQLQQKHLNLKVVAFKPIEGYKKAVQGVRLAPTSAVAHTRRASSS